MSDQIFSLYAKPTFLEGMARAFDFGGFFNIYNYSKTETEADLKALESDWKTIGKDLEIVIEQTLAKEKTETKSNTAD